MVSRSILHRCPVSALWSAFPFVLQLTLHAVLECSKSLRLRAAFPGDSELNSTRTSRMLTGRLLGSQGSGEATQLTPHPS